GPPSFAGSTSTVTVASAVSLPCFARRYCSRRITEPGFSDTQPSGALNTSGFSIESSGGCEGGSGAFSAPGASGGAVFVISVSEDFGVELDDEAVISRGA